MAEHGYTFETARNQFYTLAGIQSIQESHLVGELTQSDAVNELLKNAERQLAMMLFPAYREGRVPSLSNLHTEKDLQQNQSGSGLTSWQLPPDSSDTNVFYAWLNGWVVGLDTFVGYPLNSSKTPIVIVDTSGPLNSAIMKNPYYYPSSGQEPSSFIPAYIQGTYLKFFTAPYNVSFLNQPNIHIHYYRLPKEPTGTYSDIPKSLLELTVLLMLIQYLGVDGYDEALALQSAYQSKFAYLHASVTQALGFDPMRQNGGQ